MLFLDPQVEHNQPLSVWFEGVFPLNKQHHDILLHPWGVPEYTETHISTASGPALWLLASAQEPDQLIVSWEGGTQPSN